MGGRGSKSGMTGITSEERKEESKIKNNPPKEFDDLPSGGFEYHGSGEEQDKFFRENSNFDQLINMMSDSDRSMFNDIWVPGHFMGGQQYKGFENMSSIEKKATRVYDKYLDQSILNKGVIVNRLATAELVLGAGHRLGSLEDFRAMEGKTVISMGNMSTGAAKQGLTIGSSISTTRSWGKSVEYKIHIPSGSKGAGMWIGDRRVNRGFGRDQREFIMNRDIRLKVGKTTYDAKRDCYIVNLTFDGRIPHNYTSYK